MQSTTPDVAAYSWLVLLPLKCECSSLSENGHEQIDLNPKYCEVFPIMKAAQCGTSRRFFTWSVSSHTSARFVERDRLEIRQRRFFFAIFRNKTDLARCAAVGSQVVHMAARISSFQLISTVHCRNVCVVCTAWLRKGLWCCDPM